jgi:glyoxylase I family protein
VARPPFSLRKLDHVVLRVSDLQASLAFYVAGLGCTMEKQQANIGLYQLRAGDSLIDLVPIDEPLGRAGGAAAAVPGCRRSAPTGTTWTSCTLATLNCIA